MKNKKYLKLFGVIGLILFFAACSNKNIVIGQTVPTGLFETVLVYPISWLITKLFEITGNAGFAMVLTTVLIYVVISPLELRSQVEQRKTAELQPKLKELQEKYPNNKTDKVEQQKYMMEMQKVYQENGMSMFSGCLPIILMLVIQTPIILAMFSAVRNLTILKEATFTLFGVFYSFGQSDPGLTFIPYIGQYIKVFAIVAILTIFLSSYFTLPKGQRNPRENQTAMTSYLMNIMFIFILWGQPIALAIYWMSSNLTRIAIRLLFVNRIVEKQHEKFKREQRDKKIQKLK